MQLHSGSYYDKIKARGRIDYPIFKIVDRVEAAPFNAIVAEAHGGAAFIPTSPPALTTPATGSIAITSGRTPPIPLMPPEPPPIERYEGPEDGADDLTKTFHSQEAAASANGASPQRSVSPAEA